MVIGTTTAVAAKAALGKVANTAAAKLASDFYKNFVQPKFDGISAQKAVLEGLKKYVKSIEKITRYIPTIAIQGSLFELDDVYEPAVLVRMDDREKIEVSAYPQALFSEGSRLLVVDSAGMGKSTFLKYTTRRALESLEIFPVFIELRRIKKGQDLVSFITNELLGSGVTDACKKKLQQAFEQGDFLFAFDGYDELSEETRQIVSSEISKICAKYSSCKFVLTSRPDSGLASFTGFVQYSIKPLSRERAFDLLRRYDQGRGKAELLIEKIRLQPQVNEFLGNPLLVTLLYKAYDYRAFIPIKRNVFFRQVFEALFQDHDLSKEGAFERRKKSSLDMDDFHRAVRALGIASLKTGRVQYTSDEFSSLIEKAATLAPTLQFDTAKLRADLLSAVPLFVKDGTDIRWSHKAFQDYFAAQFICVDMGAKAERMVIHLMEDENSQRYEGVLALVSEYDVDLVRSAFILPFMKSLDGEFLSDIRFKEKDDDAFSMFVLLKTSAIFVFSDGVLKGRVGPKVFRQGLALIRQRYDIKFLYGQIHELPGIKVLVLFQRIRDQLRLMSAIDPELFSRRFSSVAAEKNFAAVLKDLGDGDPVFINEVFAQDANPKVGKWIKNSLSFLIPFARPIRSKIMDAERRLTKVESAKGFDELLAPSS